MPFLNPMRFGCKSRKAGFWRERIFQLALLTLKKQAASENGNYAIMHLAATYYSRSPSHVARDRHVG